MHRTPEPHLIKLYARHCLIGFALSAVFVAALLWLDVGGLWHLVTHVSAGPLAVFLLWAFNGIVFAGVQFAIAIMALARKPDSGSGKGARPVLAPVAIWADNTR